MTCRSAQQRSSSKLDASKAGFTLVEVLLSLGMLMLVLAAAYSALVLYQRVTYLGRKDAELSQLARAIERRISADIRCVRFQEAKNEVGEEAEPAASDVATMNSGVGAADDPGGTVSSTPSASSSTATVEVPPDTSDPLTAYMTQSTGIFGDATTLVIHISKPERVLNQSTQPLSLDAGYSTAAPLVTSELRSVSYFLATAGTGGLQGAVGNVAAGGSASYSLASGTQGLARLDGDRLVIQQFEETGGIEQLSQGADVLAPEVTDIRFRYHDGVAWLDSWDSLAMNALPKAIEVTVTIDPDINEEVVNSLAGSNDAVPASSSYRFVVAVPLADPMLGMEL